MTQAEFDYRVRVSPRSRRVCLRVTMEQGLEIVVPRGYDVGSLSDLLRRKERWIRRTLERMESYRTALGFGSAWALPPEIALPAVGCIWQVSAQKTTKTPGVAVHETGPGQLRVSGALDDERAACAALKRWLVRQAHAHLVPRLRALGLSTGLHYRGVSLRCQKTRWGSCSRERVISLNAKLLFLPPELVDYVLIHELCHLAHMNHSERFWKRVGAHCPDFSARDQQLRQMWQHVPRWAGNGICSS